MTTLSPTTLYSYRADSISLDLAIATVGNLLANAVGLFYSPEKCQLAQLDVQGKLIDSYGRPLKLGASSLDIFEARLFNANGELRWLNEADGQGPAVLLWEKPLELEGFTLVKKQAVESLPQRYLLWGEPAQNPPKANGWQRLAEARIGKLDIPLGQPLQKKDRVFLNSLEYIAEVDDFGNCAVVEERLVNLEVQ